MEAMDGSLDQEGPPSRDRTLRIIAGRELYVDWEGFLWDFQDWSEGVALEFARDMGMEGLDSRCWTVLRFMREFYLSHGRAPMNRELRQGTSMTMMELESLFPMGIRLGARRLSGLPNPKACL
jgi:tRNA 2-thiouridine synthesizing protein E